MQLGSCHRWAVNNSCLTEDVSAWGSVLHCTEGAPLAKVPKWYVLNLPWEGVS